MWRTEISGNCMVRLVFDLTPLDLWGLFVVGNGLEPLFTYTYVTYSSKLLKPSWTETNITPKLWLHCGGAFGCLPYTIQSNHRMCQRREWFYSPRNCLGPCSSRERDRIRQFSRRNWQIPAGRKRYLVGLVFHRNKREPTPNSK